MRLKQYRHEGCQSYIAFDPASRAAVVIDPQLPLMSDYRELIAQHGLKILHALDTHIHADHLSATHLFRKEFGAKIGMSSATKSERPDVKLDHGAKLKAGSLELEMLATPGHTPDSASYVIRSANHPAAVFTGDTLLIGGSGRTDFPGADPIAQFRSLHAVLGKLPGDTLVYPGHDYGDMLFSTIGTEAEKNPHWKIRTEAEFAELKGSERIVNPEGAVRATVEFNLQSDPKGGEISGGPITACGTPRDGGDRVAAISAEKLHAKLARPEKGQALIDVREPDEFAGGRLPGSINIPVSELGLHLAELTKYHRCYLVCHSGPRSMAAARTLTYVGVPGAVNLTGGFLAWQKAGNHVEK